MHSLFCSEEGKQAAAKRTLTELEERRMTIDESQLYVPERSTKRSTGVALKQKSRSDGFAKQTVSMSARGRKTSGRGADIETEVAKRRKFPLISHEIRLEHKGIRRKF